MKSLVRISVILFIASLLGFTQVNAQTNGHTVSVTNNTCCTLTVIADCGQFIVESNQTVTLRGETTSWTISDGTNTYNFSNSFSGSVKLCSQEATYSVDAHVDDSGGVTSDIVIVDPNANP